MLIVNVASFFVMMSLGLFSVMMSGYLSLPGLPETVKVSRILFFITFTWCAILYYFNWGFGLESVWEVLFHMSILTLVALNVKARQENSSYYDYTHNFSPRLKIITYNLPILYCASFFMYHLFFPILSYQ